MVIAGLALGTAKPGEGLQPYGSFVSSPVFLGPGKFGVKIDAPRASAGKAFVIYRHAATAAEVEDAPWVWDYLDPFGDDRRPAKEQYYQFNILTTTEAAERGWKNPRLISDSGGRQSSVSLVINDD